MTRGGQTEPSSIEPLPPRRVLVLDLDTPWIQSLVGCLPSGWQVDRLAPRTVGWRILAFWADSGPYVHVPGWTRAYGWSTRLLARQVNRYLHDKGQPDAVIHTIPWTAGLMRRFPDLRHVYRPHDFFGMYSWDQTRVAELESELLNQGRLAAAISSLQAEDFQRVGVAPVYVVPNGVSASFVRRLRGPVPPRPSDLPPASKKIVGCVGQMNSSYDIELMAGLADAVPDVWFVYIGPVFDEGPDLRRRFDEVFQKENVCWLGPRPHDSLPDYLHHFDVCLNPLRKTPHNDRRSPLRLYDYLATGKPILSTDLVSAAEHAPHVAVGDGVDELAARLTLLLAPATIPDADERAEYVDDQTWDARGAAFARLVDDYCCH